MLVVRKRHRVFGRGALTWLQNAANPAVAAYLRTLGGETILVLNNLSDSPQTLAITPNLRALRVTCSLAGSTIYAHLSPLRPTNFFGSASKNDPINRNSFP